MAKQKGIVKLEGTIADLTFYKSRDGYLAREKGGVPATRIANDPAFQRTRENGLEFGRAGKAGKLLRDSVRGLLVNASDSKMVGRLTRQMVRVVKLDAVNLRGERNVIDGETELLEGFEFNVRGKLGSSFYARYTAGIDRATGKLTVDIPAFVPVNMIAAPAGTTHFKVISGGTEVDFTNETFVTDTKESDILPLDGTPTEAISLENSVTAGSTLPLFVAMGLEFFQQVNGVMYSLKNGAYNSLSLVKVSGE